MSQKRIIYDLGANNGNDIPYYLKKADMVVAVEANPALCEQIKDKFSAELAQGRLILENRVLTSTEMPSGVPFFVHRQNHVLSQFPKPDNNSLADFDEITIESIAIDRLVSKWGAPHYIKIDLERYDTEILRSLFSHEIFPPFISAESHDAKVFSLLVACGGYDAFKLVEGQSVASKFYEHKIDVGNKSESYSFPEHSAGPFGEDIPGEWLTANEFLPLLGISGLGWKDIHATKALKAAPYHSKNGTHHGRNNQVTASHNSISFITVCKGRLHHIKETLPLLWREQPDEIIVVDYDCPQKVGDWVRANYPQVKVAHLSDGQTFNVARARNFGAQHASGQWLCFIDADILVSPGFLRWLKVNISEGHYYVAGPIDGKRHGETRGTVVCEKTSFFETEGYDECFSGWGGEDFDLYYKLERLGGREKTFAGSFLNAISHGDEERTALYEMKEKRMHLVETRLYRDAKRMCLEFTGSRAELPLKIRNAIHGQIHKTIVNWIKGDLQEKIDFSIETQGEKKRLSAGFPDYTLEKELKLTYRIKPNHARLAKKRFKNLQNQLTKIFRGNRTE